MRSSHRILFNTMAMYLKIIVNICVGLFTTRYVLEALGVDDFGIYALVGSVIGLLEFLNSSMVGVTQRFLSYHRKLDNLNSVFSVSVILHLLIGISVVILLEIGGFLFLDTLNIHPDRMAMAHFAFHCVAATTFYSIISTPYQALISANEDMSFIAIISIIEVFIKFGMVLSLFVIPYDRLGTYAVAIMILSILMRTVQRIFCKIRYPKVNFSSKSINKGIMRKMLSFSGWNFFSNIFLIFRKKGMPILVNLFFGTGMNAVFGLASQVTTHISSFSHALSRASAPQIVSGIAEKNLDRSKMLAISSCKFQLFLVSLLTIPLILNIDYVLMIWLRQVPEYLSVFCSLALLGEIIMTFSSSLLSLIEGRGYIRGYKISLGFCSFIPLPIAYIFLKMGYPPYSIYIALLVFPILANISRIYFARRHATLSIPYFLKEISKVFAVVLTAFILTWLAVSQLSTLNSQLSTLILSTSLSSALMLSGFWLALSAKERKFAKGLWGN